MDGMRARPSPTHSTRATMSASNAAEDTPRVDHSERNILLAVALVAAAEVCAFAWLFY